MEDLRKQANDLWVFYGKMQNRLSQAGVNDTTSLVTRFQAAGARSDAVALEELDRRSGSQPSDRIAQGDAVRPAGPARPQDASPKTRAALNGNGRADDAPALAANGSVAEAAQLPPSAVAVAGAAVAAPAPAASAASERFLPIDVGHLKLRRRDLRLFHGGGGALRSRRQVVRPDPQHEGLRAVCGNRHAYMALYCVARAPPCRR